MAVPILNSTDYTLGKGIVMIQEEETFDSEKGYRDLGNAPAFNLSVESETLEHYSSRAGLKVKDADIVTSMKAKGTLTLDVPDLNNLNLWLYGGTITETEQAAVESETTVAAFAVKYADVWLPLGLGFDLATFKIEKTPYDAGPPEVPATYYVEDTDYEIDLKAGLVRILSSGDITVGTSATVKILYTRSALDHYKIDGLQSTTKYAHIYFVSQAANGRFLDVKGYCSFKPTGDLQMIGEEFQKMDFELEFIENAAYTGIVEFVDRGKVVANS